MLHMINFQKCLLVDDTIFLYSLNSKFQHRFQTMKLLYTHTIVLKVAQFKWLKQ